MPFSFNLNNQSNFQMNDKCLLTKCLENINNDYKINVNFVSTTPLMLLRTLCEMMEDASLKKL